MLGKFLGEKKKKIFLRMVGEYGLVLKVWTISERKKKLLLKDTFTGDVNVFLYMLHILDMFPKIMDNIYYLSAELSRSFTAQLYLLAFDLFLVTDSE